MAIGALRAAVTQVAYLAGAELGGAALATLGAVPHLVLLRGASRRRSAPVPA